MEQTSGLLSCLYKNVTSFYLSYSDNAARIDYTYVAFLPIVLLYDVLAVTWNTVMGFFITIVFWILILLEDMDSIFKAVFDDVTTTYLFYIGCIIAIIVGSITKIKTE